MRNKNGDEFFVDGAIFQKNGHAYQHIVFNSGYETDARVDAIKVGSVRDKYKPSLCGIGIVGDINTRKNFHAYKIWSNIIRRCYDIKDKSYKYYGGMGVTVCDRWLRFDLFCNDMAVLPGYNEELFKSHRIELDKDILSGENKVYSPNTCMWVTSLANQQQRATERHLRNRKWAIFPDGHIEQLLNVSDFCLQHNLHRQNVNLCLSGKQKGTKGFRFVKEE